MNEESKELKQDLREKATFSGVYSIWLLFEKKAERPEIDRVLEKIQDRLGETDVITEQPDGLYGFALKEHLVTYEGGQQVPSQLLMTEPHERKQELADSIARSQFWECPDGTEILDGCKWQVMISDFLSIGLPVLERADILAEWVEIALELFPDCKAVYYQPSGKLLTVQQLQHSPYSGSLRFFYGGVNARFFKIQDTGDMLVDTLGMYALGMPDVQYHFHGLDPNAVVNHAYTVTLYQFQNEAPIASGHTIDGISPPEQWDCQYETSLIQPIRDVLDIAPGKYAAGNRE